MAAPGPCHYMRYYSDAELDRIVSEPAIFSANERRDAGAILRLRRSSTLSVDDLLFDDGAGSDEIG